MYHETTIYCKLPYTLAKAAVWLKVVCSICYGVAPSSFLSCGSSLHVPDIKKSSIACDQVIWILGYMINASLHKKYIMLCYLIAANLKSCDSASVRDIKQVATNSNS